MIYSVFTLFIQNVFHYVGVLLSTAIPLFLLSSDKAGKFTTTKIIQIRANILFITPSLLPWYFCAEMSVIIQAYLSTQERDSDLLSHLSVEKIKNIVQAIASKYWLTLSLCFQLLLILIFFGYPS